MLIARDLGEQKCAILLPNLPPPPVRAARSRNLLQFGRKRVKKFDDMLPCAFRMVERSRAMGRAHASNGLRPE